MIRYHITGDFLIVAEMTAPESINKSHIDVLKTIPDAWMLRECQCYHEEAKACKSVKGRFYQYYVHGEIRDCSEWTENHDDCKVRFNCGNKTSLRKIFIALLQIWTNSADKEAATRIIDREKERIKKRLEGHVKNDVWEKRTEPPSKEEWNKPLPAYMVDKQERSYLALWQKSREKNDETIEQEMTALSRQSTLINSAPSCTIM